MVLGHTSSKTSRHALLCVNARTFSLQAQVKDVFLGYGSIIAFLIAVHVVAFLFWIYMVVRSDKRPAKKVATD